MKKSLVIVGNWKMNVGPGQAGERALTIAASSAVQEFTAAAGQVVLCPPYVSLPVVVQRLHHSSIRVGAQNCHWQSEGAYTGEVSASMLVECGCTYVIVGHSEQRRDQGDTDARVGLRARAARGAGLIPIVCIGESAEERQSGLAEDVIHAQIDTIVSEAGVDILRHAIWAYEPLWAIGTGLTAHADDIQDIHAAIRRRCREHHGFDIPILYGGSLTPDVAHTIFAQPDVNGGLVGGASLVPSTFLQIIKAGLHE